MTALELYKFIEKGVGLEYHWKDTDVYLFVPNRFIEEFLHKNPNFVIDGAFS